MILIGEDSYLLILQSKSLIESLLVFTKQTNIFLLNVCLGYFIIVTVFAFFILYFSSFDLLFEIEVTRLSQTESQTHTY